KDGTLAPFSATPKCANSTAGWNGLCKFSLHEKTIDRFCDLRFSVRDRGRMRKLGEYGRIRRVRHRVPPSHSSAHEKRDDRYPFFNPVRHQSIADCARHLGDL